MELAISVNLLSSRVTKIPKRSTELMVSIGGVRKSSMMSSFMDLKRSIACCSFGRRPSVHGSTHSTGLLVACRRVG